MFGKKKPLRDKEIKPTIFKTNTTAMVKKCIKENAPLDFKFCRNCDYTAQCGRLRKKVLL